MQHRYSLLSAEYNQLSVECRDRDLILKDMRNALFTLRLGAQAFESYDLNPVSTTMEHMSETHAKLEALCRETQGTKSNVLLVIICRVVIRFLSF